MEKITYGLLGLLTVVVAAFGGTMYFSEDELNHAYVCTTTETVAFFDRLSSTGKTGYYTDSDSVVKSIICRNGYWINLKEYALSKGISTEELLYKGTNPPAVVTTAIPGERYRCDFVKCEVI